MSDNNRPPQGYRTKQGYGDPSGDSEVTVADAVPDTRERELPAQAVPAEDESEKTVSSLPPFVEVELVYERAYVGMRHDRWKALEIWTQNRVYVCDWGMTCIEVVDRKSGKPDKAHPLIGAHLSGGQRSEADHMEMTYPCPRPGTEAVFEYRTPRRGFVNTSTVTRVVLRLRVLTVPHERVAPTWDRLTGEHDLPERNGG